MGIIRKEAHRRVSFLMAEKSMRRKFIGASARSVGAVSVGRALDMARPVPGRVYLPDPEGDPKRLCGIDTDFTTSQFQSGGLIVLPSVGSNSAASATIESIVSPTEIRLAGPFQGEIALAQLSSSTDAISVMVEPKKSKKSGKPGTPQGPDSPPSEKTPLLAKAEGKKGTTFKAAPKVDQTQVYNAVFDRLHEGGCIGIFPEGGSHDRTELLPLKGMCEPCLLSFSYTIF